MKKHKKAVIYCRVASKIVNNPNSSAFAQERECRKKLESEKVYSAYVISDVGKSGLDLYRDGIRELLTLVKNKEVGIVCVTDWTRISRNPLQFVFLEEWLKRNGVRLVLCNESGFILAPHHIDEVYSLILCE